MRGGLPSGTAVTFAVAFAIALTVYLAAWPDAPFQDGDSPQYLAVARDLADGRLDTLHDRTPGYPALLVLTGSAEQPSRWLVVVSLLLHFVSIWLLARLLHAAGVARAWMLAFGVALLLPPFVEPVAYVMTENLAQTALVVGLFALVHGHTTGRVGWTLAASAAFALGALTRPAYQALGFVLAVCVLVAARGATRDDGATRRAWTSAVALALGFAVLVGAYASFNKRRFGYFGVTFSIGFHLSTKTMGFVERLPDEHAVVREILIRERDRQLTQRGGYHTTTQTIWSVRDELQAATGLSRPKLARHLLRLNLFLIGKAPLEYLQEVARSAAVYWFPAATRPASFGARVFRWAWVALHAGVVLMLFLHLVGLAGLGLIRVSFGSAGAGGAAVLCPTALQALAYTLAGAIVFYTMALSCLLDIGDPRQRRPTDVLIVFMCVLGAHVWHRARRERLG